jgi:hypothetical protein
MRKYDTGYFTFITNMKPLKRESTFSYEAISQVNTYSTNEDTNTTSANPGSCIFLVLL